MRASWGSGAERAEHDVRTRQMKGSMNSKEVELGERRWCLRRRGGEKEEEKA